MLSVVKLSVVKLSVVKLSVIKLSVVKRSVVKLSVVMLIVVAPKNALQLFLFYAAGAYHIRLFVANLWNFLQARPFHIDKRFITLPGTA